MKEEEINTIRKRALGDAHKLYENFARDLRDITIKYLAIGKQIQYENHTDKLIKEYNLTIKQLI